jgi:hypothetical protein
MQPSTVYIVLTQFGLQNIYFDAQEAISRALELHANDENPELLHQPVWVICHAVGGDDTQWDLGMFPDRIGEKHAAGWVSAVDPKTGMGREDYPTPNFCWSEPGEFPPWDRE